MIGLYEKISDELIAPFPNIALYAGSFNPFHLGHLNIATKALQIFDKVIIAQGVNKEKDRYGHSFLPLEEKAALKFFKIIHYDGLLSDVIKQNGYPTLVRGLRNITDVSEEMAFMRYMQDMVPNLKVIHIFCDSQYEHLSSRAIRNLLSYGKGNEYIVK